MDLGEMMKHQVDNDSYIRWSTKYNTYVDLGKWITSKNSMKTDEMCSNRCSAKFSCDNLEPVCPIYSTGDSNTKECSFNPSQLMQDPSDDTTRSTIHSMDSDANPEYFYQCTNDSLLALILERSRHSSPH